MQEESGKMTAQEYLGQVKQKIIAIRNINSGINNLREVLFSLGGTGTGERVQTSRDNDKFGSIYAKIDEKERIMDEKSKELIEFTTKVDSEICSMENPQYMRYVELLHRRYIQNESWDVISVDMKYSPKYVIQLHGRALQAFEQEILKTK